MAPLPMNVIFLTEVSRLFDYSFFDKTLVMVNAFDGISSLFELF